MQIPPDITDVLVAQRPHGPRLLRAEDVYGHPKLLRSTVPLAEWAWRLYPPQFVDRFIPDLSKRGKLARAATTEARVESGKWIADCPFCPSAQVVSPADPRFLCAGADGCANGPVNGAFVEIVFPEKSELAAIESTLLERPSRENRNWVPSETIDDLIAQNEAHIEEIL